jgi:hypothetical protein
MGEVMVGDEITDADRIRNAVCDYLDASSDYNHFSYKAANSQALMDMAVRDLRSLNGLDALRKLGIFAP